MGLPVGEGPPGNHVSLCGALDSAPPAPRTVAQEIPLTCLAHTLVELSREGLSWRLGFFA